MNMSPETWNKQVVRKTMESAGQFPGVQLHFLLMRLEQHPAALPAIEAASRDMSEWYQRQADEQEAEGRRRVGMADKLNTEK